MAAPAELPANLQDAISSFCEKDPEDLQLMDVLTVTEAMALSLRSLFTSDETPVYASAVMVAAYVRNARERLRNVRPGNLRDNHLPVARDELQAIVAHTETATNTIMELTETMMALDSEQPDYAEKINDNLMQIFEACSFQDITGQRASKVAGTIDVASDHVDDIVEVLGKSHDASLEPLKETDEERRARENLLHGPQSEAEAISQDEVDDVISQDDIDSLFD